MSENKWVWAHKLREYIEVYPMGVERSLGMSYRPVDVRVTDRLGERARTYVNMNTHFDEKPGEPQAVAPVAAKLTGSGSRTTQALCVMWSSLPMTVVELGEKLGHPDPKSGAFSSWFYHNLVWTGRVAHVGMTEGHGKRRGIKLWDLAYRTTPGYEEVPPEVA